MVISSQASKRRRFNDYPHKRSRNIVNKLFRNGGHPIGMKI
uniref:Uncharacterized protein n=1 Tax=Bacteriophage sp. TaxID=38018 RepID=A0A8D9PEC9_9VIRU|nr:MAG TPA: hypothetical protein [Bacteriophage sp.]